MIRISLGNVGSGKTANEVREMALDRNKRTYYSNIKTSIKHNVIIDPSMIVEKELVGEKKNKTTNTIEPVYKFNVNLKFWQNIKEPINVVIDEAHSILNSRRSMSKINVIITDWLALVRRVLGQTESGEGELIFITQLPKRIDGIARDMATQIRYHLCHYVKTCKKCGVSWHENSDFPERHWQCISCGSLEIKKHSHRIEIWHFSNMARYYDWQFMGVQSFYKHYLVEDIEDYFPLYNTLQWDNLFSTLY